MKLNKYVVKATIQTLVFVTCTVLFAILFTALLNYINPTGTQLFGTLILIFFGFILYNMIRTQASILESRDKLKNKE